MNTPDNHKKLKPKKNKGPLRLEAIVPITIIIALIVMYFTFFFDNHLRRGLEWGLTRSYGAEVNIGSLVIRFTEPSILIKRVQVTDKSNPKLNIVEIGEIKLQLLWDALLRGKVVVPESSILQIQVKSERSRPGRILPPRPKGEQKGAVSQAAQDTVQQLQSQNQANLLGDLFSVAGGTDYKDQLKKMESQLKSQEKMKALKAELKEKEKQWKQQIENLPDESEIKQIGEKIKGLKVDTKNPESIKASLKEVEKVYKEAREKYKTIDGAKKALGQDLNTYQNEFKGLQALIEKDINDLSQKLNIPSLDPQEINKMLLGALIANQLGGLAKYQEMAKEYLPTKSAKEKRQANEISPRERSQGLNYSFTREKSYPRFWLQKARISSSSESGEAGDLSGELKNLTNNPKHLGIPTTLDFQGNFPKQQILGVSANLTVDHTTDQAMETGLIKVNSFPVQANTLVSSSDLEIKYPNTTGQSQLEFTLKDSQVTLSSRSLFNPVQFDVQSEKREIKSIVSEILSKIRDLDLNVRATGSWDKLSLHINSSLGDRFVSAVKGQIEAEIKKARGQIESHVNGLVQGENSQLNQELSKVESQLGVSLRGREQAVQSVENTFKNKQKEIKNKELEKLKNQGKQKLQDLLKGTKLKL